MKKFMLICAPVSSRSGYGAHARDLVWSFIEHDKYDIKIQDVGWGDCPRNALSEDNEFNNSLKSSFIKQTEKGLELERQPDIYIDVRIPNEFQQIGKVNVGITAGVETNAVSSAFVEGCNRMDLVITVSEHSKAGFVNAKYEKYQKLPNGEQQKVGELKLEKPIESLFEGVDENVYKPIDDSSLDLVDDIIAVLCTS